MTREEIIAKYIKGKNILDIGSTGQATAYNLWNFLKNMLKV